MRRQNQIQKELILHFNTIYSKYFTKLWVQMQNTKQTLIKKFKVRISVTLNPRSICAMRVILAYLQSNFSILKLLLILYLKMYNIKIQMLLNQMYDLYTYKQISQIIFQIPQILIAQLLTKQMQKTFILRLKLTNNSLILKRSCMNQTKNK